MQKEGVIGAIFSLCTIVALGQLRIEQIPLSPIKANTGFFVYGANNLANEVPYSRISGSPFWNTDPINASLIIDGKTYGPCPVRINLASNEVHFLNNAGEELTAQPGIIDQIIFYAKDSLNNILTIFRADSELTQMYTRYSGLYVQELNQGHTQLLKVSKKTLRATDSLFGTQKRYFFATDETFFIKQKNRIQLLKKLNGKEILPLLHLDIQLQKWADQQRIDYSKERDVIALIEHINKNRK